MTWTATSRIKDVGRRLRSDRGESLMSLVIAMSVLAIGISALLALLASTATSAQRAQARDVATALADARMELYRDTPYTQIRLESTLIPIGTDPYVTAHSADGTIPSSTGQVTGISTGETACGSPTPSECIPTVTTAGSDHRSYRVDTYITYGAVSGGGTVKRVVVVVRSVTGTTVGPVLSRASSAFDASSI
jgi:hypothetical protein